MDNEDPTPAPETLAEARKFWAEWAREEILAGRTITLDEIEAQLLSEGSSLDGLADRWHPIPHESSTE